MDILVVEDNPTTLLQLQALLKPMGYVVGGASDGASALTLAKAHQPGIVLLDVHLPDMSGFDVCRELKANAETRHLPVVFVTGLDDESAETQCFDAGGSDFVSKPIKAKVLQARVKAHMRDTAHRRRLEGMFRDVIEFAPAAMIITDTAGAIVQVNAHCVRLFQYPRAAFTGMPVQQLIPLWQTDVAPPSDAEPGADDPSHEWLCLRNGGTQFTGSLHVGALSTAGQPLLVFVLQDVTPRKRMLQELSQSRQLVRELAAQHEAMRESERKQIAMEVHDELGQVLSALRMDLSLTQRQFERDTPEIGPRIHGMKALVDRAIAGVRDVVGRLRPPALDLGLLSALDALRGDFVRHGGCACTLTSNAATIDIPERQAILIYRIVQESLTNIKRYADARQVRIELQASGADLGLAVQDDGKGFDLQEAAQRKSFGLLGMRERALTLGGQLTIASQPGRGTRVSVMLPQLLQPKEDRA